METLVLTTPSAQSLSMETLIVRVRGLEVHLHGDWAKVFKPTGSCLALARGMKVKRGEVIFEAGIGSGVNSILAAKLGASMVHGSGTTPDAVRRALRNAELNNVTEKVDFRPGEMFAPFDSQKYDAAMADLPFVPDMPQAVARDLGLGKELVSALCGGPTGAEATISFVRDAGKRLKPGGRVYFTIGELANVQKALKELSQDFEILEVHAAHSYLPLDKPAFARFLISNGAHLDFSQRRPRFKVAVFEAKPKRGS